jgi:hypothetical protein
LVGSFLLNPEGTATNVAGRLLKGRICYKRGTVLAKEMKSATSVALCLSMSRNYYERGIMPVNKQELL